MWHDLENEHSSIQWIVPDPNSIAFYTLRSQYHCPYRTWRESGGPRRYADVHGSRVLTPPWCLHGFCLKLSVDHCLQFARASKFSWRSVDLFDGPLTDKADISVVFCPAGIYE